MLAKEPASSPSEPVRSEVSAPAVGGDVDSSLAPLGPKGRAGRWFPAAALLAVVAGICAFSAPRLTIPFRHGDGAPHHGSPPALPGADRTSSPARPASAVPQAGGESPSAPAVAGAADLPDPVAPLPGTQAEMTAEAGSVALYVVECFPSDPDALEVLARYEKWMGNTAEAVAIWSRCLELDADYGYAHHGKATVAAERGEHAAAAALFRSALDAHPDWPEAEVELARALINAGHPEEAVAVLEEHVERRPFLAEAYALLGQAHLQGDAFEKAAASYETAVQVLPSHTNAYYGLATAYTRLGRQERAREIMEEFRERKEADFEVRKTQKTEYDDLEAARIDSSAVYLNAGQIFFARGRLAEAERLWRRAAALHPGYVDCRQALAWLYRSTGRLAEAIVMLEELAQLEPHEPVYLEEIVRLHAELGQAAEAERARRRLAAQSEEK